MKAALLVLLTAAPGLEDALENERAILEAERLGLEARLVELRAERQAVERAGLLRARELAERLERARTEASGIEKRTAERPRDADRSLSLDPIFEEAHDRLDGDLPEGPDVEGAVEALFSAALTHLERSRRVRLEEGEFFAPSGTAVRGDILRVGSLAAFGRGPRSHPVAGPLSRVGREWALLETADVGLLFDRPGPLVVPLALGDPEDARRPPSGFRARLAAGGPLAFPILALGLLVLLVFVERLLALSVTTRGDEALEARFIEALERGAFGEAEALVAGKRTGVAQIAQLSLRNRLLEASARAELAKSALVEALARAERRLPLLKLIAAASPLLGLLGTVMGMIETFEVITVHGSGDATRLSGGISKALVTTELGLLVAVPALFVHGALASWVDRIADRLERCARDFPLLVSRPEARR